MTYATRESIAARVARRTQVEESPVFGRLLLQELSRLAYREAGVQATNPNDPTRVYLDIWHAALFAALVVDAETRAPLFVIDEIMTWANRDDVWTEVARVAAAGLALSEAAPDSLKSGDTETDPG